MGKVAIVTGASRGIGKAVALKLAKQGWDIAFCFQHQEEAAANTAAMIESLDVRVKAIRCDVSDFTQVKSWLERVESDFGEIDTVVNSAGITRDGPLLMMSEEDWKSVLDINLTGVFNVCRAVAFSMLKRKAGCIINMSSVSGVYGNATQTNYAATKAGIIGFSKSLAKEVGAYGIRVNTVAPGFIETDMSAKVSPAIREKFITSVPLRRLGSAEDVANLVAFLASEEASYISGQVLGVDGGLVI